MSAQNNGGPAFPMDELHPNGEQVYQQHLGMTLRDYFAAKAMQAIVSGTVDSYFANDGLYHLQAPTPESVAESAFAYADALLKAREA